MHISEGVLTFPVIAAGYAFTAAGVAIGLRSMGGEKIVRTAIFSSAFFIASLIHVPVGPGNAHLVLNGLIGVVLGWQGFCALFVALAAQALLFQFGGLTDLGDKHVQHGIPGVNLLLSLSSRDRRIKKGIVYFRIFGRLPGSIPFRNALGRFALFEWRTFPQRCKAYRHGPRTDHGHRGICDRLCRPVYPKSKPGDSNMIQNGTNARKFLFIVFALLLAHPNPALAHKVNLFCYIENGTVHGEGFFSQGSPVKNSTIEVYDLDTDTLVGETTTNDEGIFSLPINRT